MGGYALPFSGFKKPSIGKSSAMIECFSFVCSFAVIRADYDRGIRIGKNLDLIVGHERRAIIWIFDVFQEFGLVHYGSVVIRINECFGKQLAHCVGVMMQLRLVPGARVSIKSGPKGTSSKVEP